MGHILSGSALVEWTEKLIVSQEGKERLCNISGLRELRKLDPQEREPWKV